MNATDSTQPTLDCPDQGTPAFSRDSITRLSSVMRAGGETTSESRRERGRVSEALPQPSGSENGTGRERRVLAASRTCQSHT